ncbi:hypothetical protein HGP14_32835 [Rhizobium sp. P32RR-XVIII]|uniref:hypothetical protein n=1 Tax=Rhizobium sp. P32RR-XVIII TaxID=2726738 RepID=UPI0014574876|nr:hypothetical protein [Rhizobium sp. P32RR-XVIII]NLS08005.1 hypothetical protein [Rhizobium sp. P32RR-XVIII]
MPKYYIIPITEDNSALFGLKSATNPYPGDGGWWCAGCPNPFGGNDDRRTIAETLYMETREESHYKIDLDQMFVEAAIGAINAGGNMQGFRQVHAVTDANPRRRMIFYAMRGHFSFELNPFVSRIILEKTKYQETTGQVVRINLDQGNWGSALAAAGHALGSMPAGASQPTQSAQMELRNSASMVALLNARNLIFNGHL